MSLLVLLRLAARESRGARGRLLLFALCLSVGVAAVTCVAALSVALDESVRSGARELLAGDVSVSARRPLPDELETFASEAGALRAEVLETASLARRSTARAASDEGTNSALVQLKVIDARYPFYGALEVRPPGADGAPPAARLGADGCLVAPELAERLGLQVGDSLSIGVAAYDVRGFVLAEPDRLGFGLTLGPRVFLGREGFERADLARAGSAVRYRALLRLPDGSSAEDVRAFTRRLRDELPDAGYLRIESYADAQPGLRSGIARVETYLGLVALLSLLVGGVGVAQTVRAWIASRADAIAVQKCLGLTPRDVALLYTLQATGLALLGSAIGVTAGLVGAAVVAARLAAATHQPTPDVLQAAPVLRGLLLGLAVALTFAAGPLSAAVRVPPARVLRRGAEPPAASLRVRAALGALVLLGLFGTALAQSGSPRDAGAFAGGVAVVAGLLALAARGLERAARWVPLERVGPALRHGLAALARGGREARGATVALGLGVLVVLAMVQIERRLAAELEGALPADAPSAFLVDVQPEQWPGVETLLLEEGASSVESVPVVVARLRAIDGRSVEDIASERFGAGGRDAGRASSDAGARRARWVLTREQRLTYGAELPPDNEVVAGALWSRPEADEISLERDFANDLGVGVGARLEFDLQGVPIELVVTSIRSVEWRSFGINFYLWVESGVLEDAPQFRVATARLPEGGEARVQDRLAAAFPNVTLVQTGAVLETLGALFGRVALGVRLLGSLTALAGIAILAGAIGASGLRRAREAALLKVLGSTRAGVLLAFGVEYALSGLVAGVVGALGGSALAWTALSVGMDLEPRLSPVTPVAAALLAAGLAAVAGLAASARALSAPALLALREE